MITNFSIPTNPNGYSFIDGKLESCVFERAIVEVNDTEINLSFGLVLPNGSTTIVPYNKFFNSVDDFKKDIIATMCSVDISYRKMGVQPANHNEGNAIFFYHLEENGVEKTVTAKYMIVYVAATAEMNILGDNFPTNKYPSRRDLFENESFTIKEDGKEKQHICIKDLLTLNAAQDKAVAELKKAIDECIDLGIVLAADSSDIVALNTTNLKSFAIDFDGNGDFTENTENFFKFGKSIRNRILVVNEDEELFFERKDEE